MRLTDSFPPTYGSYLDRRTHTYLSREIILCSLCNCIMPVRNCSSSDSNLVLTSFRLVTWSSCICVFNR